MSHAPTTLASVTIAVDHLVVAVRDLERTTREFRAAGITVVDSGGHEKSSTVRATIPCAAGTFVELRSYESSTLGSAVRLIAKAPVLGSLLGDRSTADRRVAHAAGLIGLTLRVTDLDAAITRLRTAGFWVPDAVEHSDGDARWRKAVPDDSTLPALVSDLADTAARIPDASDISIDRVTIVSDDVGRTAVGLTALLGEPACDTWQLEGTTVRLDAGELSDKLPALRARITAPGLPPTASTLGFTSPDADSGDAAADRLAQALRLETVSYEDASDIRDDQFVALGEFIESSYPRVHETLSCRKFGHSRLYTWQGRDADPAALFLAHMDVVPVDDPDGWTHPPFAGVVDDEFVWGRGAIDDKSRVFACLEAIEQALTDGVVPAGTLYFAFGHDEEIGGENGAARIAEHLLTNGIRPRLLLDEGGVVTRGVVDGIDRPVASIMLGEKGFATVRLATQALGGHSSMPPKQTAVGRIAAAVARLQDNPMPVRMTPVVLDMAKRLAPFMSEPRRSLLGSADRLSAVVARIFTMFPPTEALVRTTTAPTVIRGGVKANVLPQNAEALVNFRILPGESVADVLTHCRDVIADDEVRVELAPGMIAEPSPVADSADPGFELLARTVRELIPDVAVTTGLVPGATDARHYNDVARARFNFAPIVIGQSDLDTIHGTNERLSRENYARLIRFNRRLIDQL